MKKTYTRFQDNIWAADLAEMGSLSSQNKKMKCVLCFTGVFTKQASVKPEKDKKGKTVQKAFIKTVNESIVKPNKLWIDQERQFYNKPMQKRLHHNYILRQVKSLKGKGIIRSIYEKDLLLSML